MSGFGRLVIVVVLMVGDIGCTEDALNRAPPSTAAPTPEPGTDDVVADDDECLTPADCAGSVPAPEVEVDGVVAEQLPPPLPPWDEPCDGLDGDGDGVDPCEDDLDHDGFPASNDCDDQDPRRNMDAAEIWCDGIDQNCSGYDDCDTDGDGALDAFDCAPVDPRIDLPCNGDRRAVPGD